jgi:hypothetical protein
MPLSERLSFFENLKDRQPQQPQPQQEAKQESETVQGKIMKFEEKAVQRSGGKVKGTKIAMKIQKLGMEAKK